MKAEECNEMKHDSSIKRCILVESPLTFTERRETNKVNRLLVKQIVFNHKIKLKTFVMNSSKYFLMFSIYAYNQFSLQFPVELRKFLVMRNLKIYN